jgi:hypothetical protein
LCRFVSNFCSSCNVTLVSIAMIPREYFNMWPCKIRYFQKDKLIQSTLEGL